MGFGKRYAQSTLVSGYNSTSFLPNNFCYVMRILICRLFSRRRFGFKTLYLYPIGFFSVEPGFFAVALSSGHLFHQSFILSFNKHVLGDAYVSAIYLPVHWGHSNGPNKVHVLRRERLLENKYCFSRWKRCEKIKPWKGIECDAEATVAGKGTILDRMLMEGLFQ